MSDDPNAKMHDPREAIHFVAATELYLHGKLSVDTVELLCLLAPQPITQFVPGEPGKNGVLTVAFWGSGSAMHGSAEINPEEDARRAGAVYVREEDRLTGEIAKAMKQRLQAQVRQYNSAVSKAMKEQAERKKTAAIRKIH